MKKVITPILLFLTFIIFSLQSCGNKKQEATIIDAEVTAEIIEEYPTPKDFNSAIRPNEKVELGKTYTDTLKYKAIDDDGDYWLLYAEKDKNRIGLIYNDEYNFIKGDEIEIKWKMDSLRYAGDPEDLHFGEFLVSAKKVKSLNLTAKNVKFLWRENLYNEELETEINSIVINDEYIKNISEPEKAALAYTATFIGNECEWDGNMAENRGNLKCKILSALNLGYQCSNTHLEFLKRWFRNNETVLKELERCPTKPDGATVQNTFDEINIDVNENNITVFFKASGYNLRESETWNWTEKHYFEFKENELILIKKDISPKEHHTFEVTEN